MAHTPIQAELRGATMCSAMGVTAQGYAPALELCRMLVAEGYDPATPMQVSRNGVLSLLIRSIGAAAGLCVEDDEIGRPRFRKRRVRGGGRASHIAPNEWDDPG
jgi:hypothetical protein